MSFINLHNHSDYSDFDAINKIPNMVKRARELGQTALGLSDHGTTRGLLKFYLECNKTFEDLSKQDQEKWISSGKTQEDFKSIKPVLGCEFYIADDLSDHDRKKLWHICLYARDLAGLKNLNKLNSFSQRKENFYYKPRIDFNVLKEYSQGLIATTACMGGLIKRDDALEKVTHLQEIFNDNLFIELHTNTLPEQKEFNFKAVDIAEKLGILVTAAIDSHYLNKEDAEVHRLWLNIKDDSSYYPTDDFYMMDQGEVVFALEDQGLSDRIIDEAIGSTNLIAQMCNVVIPKEKMNYPEFPIKDKRRKVGHLVAEGLNKKFGRNVPVVYAERVDYELDMLDQGNYLNYFLIVHDFLINGCDKQGIGRGVGRGSVVASAVSWLMDITKIDPVKYDLLFERFMHLERLAPPDIDMDVQTTKRGEAIDYLKKTYGHDRVYQVATENYVKAKASIHRAGQALKIEPSLLNVMSKGIDSLDKVSKPEGMSQEIFDRLIWLAGKFDGLIQNFGVHASAVIVLPKEPETWCSIEKQGDELVINTNFKMLEEYFGLLKLDVLGLKTLDVIYDTIKLTGRDIDIDNLPEEDGPTFDMLCKGETKGCFQVESQGMTKLVKDLKPKCYRDIIPIVALYRPGPMEAMIEEYKMSAFDLFVARRQGKVDTTYIHTALEPILSETYGIILYQEQTLKIARELCGYSLGEADLLRRAIGKKEKSTMGKISVDFIQRAVGKGIPEESAETIWGQIETFARYGFNMGHSAAYGYISYQTAYLKANYPKEYMCALLNSEKEKETVADYVRESQRMGIEILPPRLPYARRDWVLSLEGISVGLKSIAGVGNIRIPSYSGNFIDYLESHYKMNRKPIEALIKAGCFEGNRGLQLAQLDWYKEYKPRELECRQKAVEASEACKDSKVIEWVGKLNDIPNIDLVQPLIVSLPDVEREVLGFTFHEKMDQYDLSFAQRKAGVIAGEVMAIKPWSTVKCPNMAFVKFRTQDGYRDLVIFNDKYRSLELNEVYFAKVSGTQIADFTKARRKVVA